MSDAAELCPASSSSTIAIHSVLFATAPNYSKCLSMAMFFKYENQKQTYAYGVTDLTYNAKTMSQSHNMVLNATYMLMVCKPFPWTPIRCSKV